jgi:hypothetical protein
MTPPSASSRFRGLLLAASAVLVLASLAAAPFIRPVRAQSGVTITIRMFDGRTAKPIIPTNLLVRVDHHDDIHSETLQIDDQGVGTVTLPADAKFVSVQGTYDAGMEIYLNCDAGMERNLSTLHWYALGDVVSKGVIAPNECYKGKYERNPRVQQKPGELDFFVRKTNFGDEIKE